MMNDNNDSNIPLNLAAMLPAGMLASGGTAAEAMAALAQRQHGVAGWEAFHYERISDAQFDITGGMAQLAGGAKKWPGPHDIVTVSEPDILQEMRDRQAADAAGNPSVITSAPGSANAAQDLVKPHVGAGSTEHYLKVVFSLPEDAAARQRIFAAFQLQANFSGAKVQACSLHEGNPAKLDG
ncbi:hypothetical protein BH11PSE12_BH11PSE12_06270 [soil metagenome]